MKTTDTKDDALLLAQDKIRILTDEVDFITQNRSLVSLDRALFAPDTFKDDPGKKMWEFYAASLKNFITGGRPATNLQLATSLNPIRWDHPIFGNYYFHVDTADTIPELGGSYKKSSDKFGERYRDFLFALEAEPIDPAALDNARLVREDIDTARVKALYLENYYGREWVKFDQSQAHNPPSRRISVERWYELVKADKAILAQFSIIDEHEKLYYYWLQKALSPDEPLLEAIKKYREFVEGSANGQHLLSVNVPRSTENPESKILEKRHVLPYVLSPDFPAWIKEAPKLKPNLKFTYSQNAATYDYSRTRVGGGAFIGFGFFGAIGGGSRTTTRIDSSSKHFKFKFNAVAECFTIGPDQWYDSTIFQLYQNGPFKDGSPLEEARKQGRLFGPKGFINFRSARAIVAYKPQVSLQFSMEEYHYYKQVTQGWTVFAIGPFVVGGGSYTDVKVRVRSNDNAGTLELFGDNDLPYLLGFEYEDMDPTV